MAMPSRPHGQFFGLALLLLSFCLLEFPAHTYALDVAIERRDVTTLPAVTFKLTVRDLNPSPTSTSSDKNTFVTTETRPASEMVQPTPDSRHNEYAATVKYQKRHSRFASYDQRGGHVNVPAYYDEEAGWYSWFRIGPNPANSKDAEVEWRLGIDVMSVFT
ncbi:hypothetical protein TWF481_003064 [Arthrobotrys musiformis]|uniref:Uncharacterized protein n=1 Tax=Arthrobotrys musiformis TaxID=47236 RepID=A0AAV9VS67_9PEZI